MLVFLPLTFAAGISLFGLYLSLGALHLGWTITSWAIVLLFVLAFLITISLFSVTVVDFINEKPRIIPYFSSSINAEQQPPRALRSRFWFGGGFASA